MTGRLTKTPKYTGVSGTSASVVDKDSPYVIITKANSLAQSIEDSTSSFVIYGKQQEKLDDAGYVKGESSTSSFITARIVLRDYLEGTYLGDNSSVLGEKIAVMGRKIRFTEFPTKDTPLSKSISFAKFVDINGDEIAGSTALHCDDFAGIATLAGSNSSVKYIKWKEDKDKEASSGGELGSILSPTLSDNLSSVDKLKFKSTDTITMTNNNFMFPGTNIDSADKGANRLPVFYVMALNTSAAQNGLMTWINDTSDETGYDWWSRWLQNNGYSYPLAGNTVDALFQGDYDLDAEGNSYVVLDLDTVSSIEKMYEEKEDDERVTIISTVFMLCGWVIILLAQLLPFLWLMDTSFNFGFNIIEKISFGHWVAIKDRNDVPEMDTNERHYIDFWATLGKSGILIVMGVTLIKVNILGIIARLIGSFGELAIYVSDKIRGM
jgi:hypothetical protein